MLKQITTAAALSLMMAGAALAAQPTGGAPPGSRQGWGMKRGDRAAADLARLKTQLSLTSGQQDAWNRFADAIQTLRTPPPRPAPAATKGLVPAPEVFATLAERAEARAKDAHALSDAAAALYKALTPAQRAVLDTHVADVMAMHRFHRGHWRHRGDHRGPSPGSGR